MIVDFTGMKQGEKITGFFTIRKIEYKSTKDDKGFVVLELGNRFGRLRGVLWKGAEDFLKEFNEKDIVKIQGKITFYNETKQITIEKVRKLIDDDDINIEELIPHAECDLGKLKDKLFNLIVQIEVYEEGFYA